MLGPATRMGSIVLSVDDPTFRVARRNPLVFGNPLLAPLSSLVIEFPQLVIRRALVFVDQVFIPNERAANSLNIKSNENSKRDK